MELINGVCIKRVPRDFRVEELSACVPNRDYQDYRVLRITKTGMTTEQVAQSLSSVLCLERELITYSDMKDEDALTSQFMNIGPLPRDVVIQSKYIDISGKWQFESLGYAGEPLRFGDTRANSFSVKLHRVTSGTRQTLLRLSGSTFPFLNYSDIQRFGVPGAPKDNTPNWRSALER